MLEDLRHAADTEVPAILARFAAVRAVRLMDLAAPARAHAVEAALAHLEAVGPDWSEGHWLRGPIEGSAGSKCLERAARAASARGHEAGARALRQEVHRRQWARLGVLPHWLS